MYTGSKVKNKDRQMDGMEGWIDVCDERMDRWMGWKDGQMDR